jgi:lipoprotein-releasing system permease protein
MRVDNFIASRIFSFGKDNISSVVIRIALISVSLGLAVMLISVSVLIGFKEQIRDKIIGFAAHIQVVSFNNNQSVEESPFVFSDSLRAQLGSIPAISSAHAVANKAGIIRTDDHIQGVILKGVDQTYDWHYLGQSLVSGVVPVFSDSVISDDVLISKQLANRLLLNPGDPIRMWFVGNDNRQARGRRFIVSGIYETGLFEFDERFIFGDIRHVQRLNGWNESEVGTVEIKLQDIGLLERTSEQVYYSLPIHLTSYDAYESYPHIFDWLNLQDMNVIIIILLMIFVSGITMVSTLLIIILEKTRLIGLLKAMGAGNQLIKRVFLIHSLKILLYGMGFGNFIAIAFVFIQYYFGLFRLPAESYYLSEVPVSIAWFPFFLINLGAVFLWMIAFILPVSVINAVSPAQSIKFN